MANELKGKKVAILVDDGFELAELTEPKRAIEAAGGTALIVSAMAQVQGWNHDDKADVLPCDVELERARVDDFDALMLPGGVKNPDRLRQNERAVALVRAFFERSKPVAAICHAL